MKLEGSKIDFLGDSITEGCGTSGPDCRFSALLQRSCELAEARNYGISGTRYARQRVPSESPYTDMDFCGRAGQMDRDADVVFVFGGTNDFGHGDAPFGGPEDRTPDTFCGACHYLFRELKVNFPQAEIVVATPMHRCREDDPYGSGRKTEPCPPLREYAAAIRQTAQEYGLHVLDLFGERFLDPNDPEIQQKYVPDGLHPNDEGHVLLAERIARFLEAL